MIVLLVRAGVVGLALASSSPRVDVPPDVVLIGIDTLRSDHLGCYGYGRATSPHVDRLASKGVLFEQCQAVASLHVPAFTSLLTGLLPITHGCLKQNDRLLETIPTLAQRFGRRGYFCSAVVASTVMNGRDRLVRGFDLYDDYTCVLEAWLDAAIGGHVSNAAEVEVAGQVSSGFVTREARRHLAAARCSGKPFFLFVHYFDPHSDYVAPAPLGGRFDPDYRGPMSGRDLLALRETPPDGRDLEHLKALYDAEIAFTDRHVGKLLKHIRKVSPDALIILVGSHGQAFAEHGRLGHGNSTYLEELRTPMIWQWPGVLPEGHRVTAPVAAFDVAKTLAELLRFEGRDRLQGRSLWPALRGGRMSPMRPLLVTQSWMGQMTQAALTLGSLRLHAQFRGRLADGVVRFAFFDLSDDPGEQRDLWGRGDPRIAGMQAELQRQWAQCMGLRAFYRRQAAAVGTAGPTRKDQP